MSEHLLHLAFDQSEPEGLLPILPVRPVQEKVMINDLELSYLVWGDRSKPALILQHGGRDHARSWDWTVAGLIDDWCCIAPDMRGHGDSGRAPGAGYLPELLLSDFAGLMDHLQAEGFSGPFPMIGHSAGGNVVLHYAAVFPDRVSRLVAMEGLGASKGWAEQELAKPLSARLHDYVTHRLGISEKPQRCFETLEDMIARMAKIHPNLTPVQAAHLAGHGARRGERGWHWKFDPAIRLAAPPRMMHPDEYLPLYSKITAPVLLMRGTKSWATDPLEDGRIEAFCDVSLINYEGAGHWMHHDRFDYFLRDVKEFLNHAKG